MAQRRLLLSSAARAELVQWRDHAPKPWQRERAAALLKVAAGIPAAVVARTGLLQVRDPDTLYAWLDTYAQGGCAALMQIQPGRGRKPAFSPCPPRRSRRP
jgi:hypothetical protein